MAYNFVSLSMFVIAAVCFVGKFSLFVIAVRKPWVGLFCNKFVGVV